jgi:succinate dehydrogenase / fumarate reductase flavoprotein subunit
MMDLVIVNGKARGIIVRNLITGEYESHAGDAVLLCTGGYGNVFYLSPMPNPATWEQPLNAGEKGPLWPIRVLPRFTPLHPELRGLPGKTHIDEREFEKRRTGMVPKKKGDTRRPNDIPESERWYYLEEKYPSFGNLVPRDVASRNAKYVCDAGHGVGPPVMPFTWTLAKPFKRRQGCRNNANTATSLTCI